MHDFPYSKDEWSRVSEAARAVVNASFAEDEVAHAAALEQLHSTIAELRRIGEEHPILLETEADFTNDPAEQVRLYLEAIALALAGGWPTYTIRISLARLLLDDFDDARRAMNELLACREELEYADQIVRQEYHEFEARQWQELQSECAARLGEAPRPGGE